MNRTKWQEFARLQVLCAVARARQKAAYRQLVEARERLEHTLRQLDDATRAARPPSNDSKHD